MEVYFNIYVNSNRDTNVDFPFQKLEKGNFESTSPAKPRICLSLLKKVRYK